MSQRRRAAEIAEKKAADSIRADDIVEEAIPELKSLNTAPSQSSNGKPSLAGVAAKAKMGAMKPEANKESKVKQLEQKADEEEKEKTMKFDKSKKESGGKRGEASTHDRLSAAGKKGASVRWSKERQEQEGGPDPEYKMKPENEDDKEAYKEEFAEEVEEEPEENPEEEPEEEHEEEETNEEETEGKSKGEQMHKVRVEAGKKAIATRKARVKEQDPGVKTDEEADAVLHDQLSALGKKGASARWSRDKDEDTGGDENQGAGNDKEARLHDIRVQAGKKAMATRKQRLKEQDPGVQSDEEADEALHEQLSAIGKKGADARWSRDKGQEGDEGEGEEYQGEEDEDREARLHNTRVQAGKKAMATRKQRLREQDPGVHSDEEAEMVLHEQLSAIGKKGASARWSREKGEASAEEEEESDEDEDEKAARLHRTRVEAGKKAAATRKAHAQQQQNSAGESDDGDVSTHDKLSAAGKKGAATRWARAKKRDSEGENGNEGNANMKKARGSSRVAMEHWKALEIKELFLHHSPDLVVDINVSVPRRGAFEIIVTSSRGVETTLWSGLKRGPPRRLKFPDPEMLVAGLKEALA